jgi:hypothetical protein
MINKNPYDIEVYVTLLGLGQPLDYGGQDLEQGEPLAGKVEVLDIANALRAYAPSQGHESRRSKSG